MSMDDREIEVFTLSDIIGGGNVEIVTQDRYNEELEIIRLKKKGGINGKPRKSNTERKPNAE